MAEQSRMLSLRAIGIAAGTVAIILFTLLFLTTGAVPVLIVGECGGALLIAACLLAGPVRGDADAARVAKIGRGSGK